MQGMGWDVEFTSEFEFWWMALDELAQDAIDRAVHLLEGRGPTLGFPHTSDVRSSKHGNMRELRVQVGGDPHRILYAFNPRRTAILLIGGSKLGDDQFYERMVPIADRLYDEHLEEIEREGRLKGKEK
jgi:hypothetical protein